MSKLLNSRTPSHDNVFVRGDLSGELMKLLPPHIKPDISEYMKNNSSFRTGVSFCWDESAADDNPTGFTPIIYVDPFLAQYERGEISMSDIAVIVAEEYYRYADLRHEAPDFLESFDLAKPRLAFKLKNTLRNEEFLKTVPHVDILDLSVVFFYLASTDEHGMYVCTVTNEIMEDWGVDTETLFDIALANAPKLLPPMLRPMREMIPLVDDIDEPANDVMYVMGNTGSANGAAVLMYKDFLRECCERLGDDIYILPSSVHELIVLKAAAVCDRKVLREIVADVNTTIVHPEDFLSGSVYFVSRSSGILEYA